MRVATTVRAARHRLEDRLAERLDQRRPADDIGGGEPARHLVMRDAPDDPHARAALERARSGPSPTKVSEPRPSRANASARRTTFLRSVSEPTCTNAGRLELARGRRTSAEALEVDARVDDLGLAARRGQLVLELAPQVVGDRDHRRGARRRRALVSAADAGDRADVAHVAAVRGDDERRVGLESRAARRERGSAPTMTSCGPAAPDPAAELEEAALAAAARSRTASSISCPRSRSACSTLRDERAEVGVGRPRVHLRDEEDPQANRRGPVVLAPLRRGGRRRSRRSCSARAARRASAGAGCPSRAPRRERARAPLAPRPRSAPARTFARALELAPLRRRVDRLELDRLLRVGGVPVDADDHALARSTCLLPSNAAPSISPCTQPCSTAATAPPISSIRSISSVARASQLVGQRLDVVRAAERVGRVGRAAPRSAGSAACAARSSRRARVGSASASSNEFVCSDCAPPHTAESAWIATRTMLFSGCCAVSVEPPVCAWKRSASAFGFVAPNRSRMIVRPEPPRRPELRDLLEEVVVRVEEEREPRAEIVRREPGRDRRVAVGDAVRERERELLHRGRARLADVVARRSRSCSTTGSAPRNRRTGRSSAASTGAAGRCSSRARCTP